MILELLQEWLLGHGVSEALTFYVARTFAVVAVLLLSAAANFVAKRYIVTGLTYAISRTRSEEHTSELQSP